MAINFPDSPSLNEIFTAGDRTWQWDGTAWVLLSTLQPTFEDLTLTDDLYVQGDGKVDGHFKANEFFVSPDPAPTFAASDNAMYAGYGRFSIGDKLVFDSATPGSGGFGMLTVTGRIRGALENYEIVSLDKGTKTISNGQISSGVATITTSTSHGFAVGDTVILTSMVAPFTSLEGAHRVTGTGTNTFTFDTSSSDQSSQATSGNAKIRELTIGLHPEIVSPDGGVISPAGLGMRLDEYNYWFLNNQFRVGSASKYFRWNGSTLEIVGKVTADEGAIGGWTIGASTLTGGNTTLNSAGTVTVGTSNDVAVLSSSDLVHRIWVGHATPPSAPFKVTKTGYLTASGAVIQGSLNAADLALNGDITIKSGGVNLLSNYLVAGTSRFGVNVSGTDDGIWLNTHNYWYDTGNFKVGGAAQNVIWDTSSLTVTGIINATSGNLTGALTVASGTMKFGQGADGGSNNGLYVGANDYWYSTGAFRVGGSNGISYTGSGNISIGTNVTISGTLSAATGSFSGTITANSGTIAGWTISPTAIHNGATVGIGSGATPFWAGGATPNSAFSVTSNGALRATNANITGRVTATSGAIGGWTVNSSTITGGSATLDSTGNLTLGTGNDVVRLSATDGSYRLWAGNTSPGSANFAVSTTGVLTATNANVTGTITATSGSFSGSITSSSGSIGGWNIGPTSIHNSGGTVGLGSGATPFWAGGATPNSAFSVTSNGNLRATNANITGIINATSGVIGGFSIGSNTLTAGAGANQVGIDTGGVNPAFYAGSSGTHTNAAFRVTNAGALTATNAVITGAITATSGSFAGLITSTSGSIGGWTISPTGIHNGTTVGMGSGATPFWAGGATPNSAFSVTSNGNLRATNANIAGTISTTSGNIGGWTIGSTAITSNLGNVSISSGATPILITGATPSNPAFTVTSSGSIRALNANITGVINATSGTFTGYVTAGNMRFGTGILGNGLYINSNNLWLDDGSFLVGGAGGIAHYGGIVALGSNVTLSGALSGATGTFSGTLSGGAIDIGGADSTSFHVDTNGNMWVGSASYGTTTPFRVSSGGVLRVYGVNDFDGALNGTITLNPSDGTNNYGFPSVVFGGSAGSIALMKNTASSGDMYINTPNFMDIQAASINIDASTYAYIIGSNAAHEMLSGNHNFTTGGTTRLNISSSGLTVTGSVDVSTKVLGNASDTDAAPTYTWTGDTDTGMYRVGANQIGFSTGSTQRLLIDSSGLVVTGAIDLSGGIVTAGRLNTTDGTAGAPAMRFNSDTDTGIYRETANDIRVVGGGSWGLAVINGVANANPNTTTSTTTWRVAGLGTELRVPTSKRDTKERIEDLSGEEAFKMVSMLNPRKFFFKRLPDDTDEVATLRQFDQQIGFIAEEVADVSKQIGLNLHESEFSKSEDRDLEDRIKDLDSYVPSYWKEPHMIALSIAVCKELVTQVNLLKQEIEQLKLR